MDRDGNAAPAATSQPNPGEGTSTGTPAEGANVDAGKGTIPDGSNAQVNNPAQGANEGSPGGQGNAGGQQNTGKIIGYRVPDGRGGTVVISPEEYQRRLTSYPDISRGYGQATNQNSELMQRIEEMNKQISQMKSGMGGTTAAQQQAIGELQKVSFSEEDIDDPKAFAEKMEVYNKNFEIMQGMASQFQKFQSEFETTIKKTLSESLETARETDKANQMIESAIANDPQLSQMARVDPNSARDFALAAIRYGDRVNKNTQTEVFADVSSAIAGYRAAMTGNAPVVQPITNAGFVTELREGQFQPPSTGGDNGGTVDVVQTFKDKVAAGAGQDYLRSLSPEQRQLIEKAAAVGEV